MEMSAKKSMFEVSIWPLQGLGNVNGAFPKEWETEGCTRTVLQLRSAQLAADSGENIPEYHARRGRYSDSGDGGKWLRVPAVGHNQLLDLLVEWWFEDERR